MATVTSSPRVAQKGVRQSRPGEEMHKLLLATAIVAAAALLLYLANFGYSYYRLGIEARPLSPLHSQLRSSGAIGIRLGVLGVGLFFILFLYPIRKHWKWLAGIGNTRHWFDFHSLVGIVAPLVITFHTAFKWQGLAGLAYWIMVAVALSGFVGRYVYSRIPRGMNSVQLTMGDLEAETEELADQLHEQGVFSAEDLAPLLDVPPAGQIRRLGLAGILPIMISKDLARPFLVSRLRRRVVSGAGTIFTLGGLLPCQDKHMEAIIANVRRQSRLRNSMAFLDSTERVLHLWHVIHRPFSFSFILLAVVHIGVVLSVGLH